MMAMTRGDGRRRRAGTLAVLVAAGVLAWPGTAYAADVTTNPTEGRQGEAVKLEFVVPEERAGTRTERIEIRLPADAPVAEVYPMSVAGWAPQITSRTLDKPLPGIHSSGVDTVTSAVTWIRMPESGGSPAQLTLSMGPLPQAERLTFEIIQTYADGTVVRWAGPDGAHRAPVLTLLPAASGVAAAGHGGHGAAPTGAAAGPGAAAGGGPAAPPAGTPRSEEGGNADSLLAAGLLAGLGGGAAIGWFVSRWRRRDASGPIDRSPLAGEPAADAAPEATATGEAATGEPAADAVPEVTATRPADAETPVDMPAAARVEAPGQDPAQAPIETPADAGTLAATPVDTPVQALAKRPVDTPAGTR